MPQDIQLKRSNVPGRVPTIDKLDSGEFAINTWDGRVFIKKVDNNGQTIIELGTVSGSIGISTGIINNFITNNYNIYTSSVTNNFNDINNFTTSINNFTTSINNFTQSVNNFTTSINNFTQSISSGYLSTSSFSSSISGSINNFPIFNSSNSIGNSIQSQSGSYVVVSGSLLIRNIPGTSSAGFSLLVEESGSVRSIRVIDLGVLIGSGSIITASVDLSGFTTTSSFYAFSQSIHNFTSSIKNYTASINVWTQSINNITGGFLPTSSLIGSPTYLAFFSGSRILSSSLVYQTGVSGSVVLDNISLKFSGSIAHKTIIQRANDTISEGLDFIAAGAPGGFTSMFRFLCGTNNSDNRYNLIQLKGGIQLNNYDIVIGSTGTTAKSDSNHRVTILGNSTNNTMLTLYNNYTASVEGNTYFRFGNIAFGSGTPAVGGFINYKALGDSFTGDLILGNNDGSGNTTERNILTLSRLGRVLINSTSSLYFNSASLQVYGGIFVSGSIFDSSNSTGSLGQVLTNTSNGILWQNSGSSGGGAVDLSGYLTTSSFNQFSQSINLFTASVTRDSASFNLRINQSNTSQSYYTLTSSFQPYSQSINLWSQSINNFTSSVIRDSASFDARINAIGSNFNTGSFVSTSSLVGGPNYIAFFSASRVLSSSMIEQTGVSGSVVIRNANLYFSGSLASKVFIQRNNDGNSEGLDFISAGAPGGFSTIFRFLGGTNNSDNRYNLLTLIGGSQLNTYNFTIGSTGTTGIANTSHRVTILGNSQNNTILTLFNNFTQSLTESNNYLRFAHNQFGSGTPSVGGFINYKSLPGLLNGDIILGNNDGSSDTAERPVLTISRFGKILVGITGSLYFNSASLQVYGNTFISGALYDSSNSTGSLGQALTVGVNGNILWQNISGSSSSGSSTNVSGYLLTSSFNSYTQSINTWTQSINDVTGSFLTINSYNNSVNGNTNRIAVFTGGHALGNSIISQSNNFIHISGALQVLDVISPTGSTFDTVVVEGGILRKIAGAISGSFLTFGEFYAFSQSIHNFTSSIKNYTASINVWSSSINFWSQSINLFTSSVIRDSGSFDTRITNVTDALQLYTRLTEFRPYSQSTNLFTSSVIRDSASFDSRINAITSSGGSGGNISGSGINFYYAKFIGKNFITASGKEKYNIIDGVNRVYISGSGTEYVEFLSPVASINENGSGPIGLVTANCIQVSCPSNSITGSNIHLINGALNFSSDFGFKSGAAYMVFRPSGNANVSDISIYAKTGSATELLFFKFSSSGDFYSKGDGVFFSSFSDSRLKININKFTGSIDLIKKLNGVKYEWIKSLDRPGVEYGLIAQEVEKIIPEVVKSKPRIDLNGESYKTVQYDKLVPILIEAIKEQQKQIDELKEKINEFTK